MGYVVLAICALIGLPVGFYFFYRLVFFKEKRNASVVKKHEFDVIKKSEELDIDKNRILLLITGLFVSIVFTFLIFLMVNIVWVILDDNKEEIFDFNSDDVEITIQNTPPPEMEETPPPPPPDVVEIVETKVDIEDDDTLVKQPQPPVITPPVVAVKPAPAPKLLEIYNLGDENLDNPIFKCGTSIQTFISDHYEYPQIYIEQDIQKHGYVVVVFTVDKNGDVIDIDIPRGIDTRIDKEAMRVMNSLKGCYEPGKMLGTPVKVKYQISLKL